MLNLEKNYIVGLYTISTQDSRKGEVLSLGQDFSFITFSHKELKDEKLSKKQKRRRSGVDREEIMTKSRKAV